MVHSNPQSRPQGNQDGHLADTEGVKALKGECWLYAGTIKRDGYGKVMGWANGKSSTYLAHRVLYEALVGEIPAGLSLDHLCRVRSCINPDHLEPVTHRENQLRGFGVSGLAARRTHCPQGHPYDEVRTDGKGKTMRGCRSCRLAANYRYKAKMKSKADNRCE